MGGGIGVGYDIPLTEKIKLEPMFRYVINYYKNKEDDNYNNADIIVNMGFIYAF